MFRSRRVLALIFSLFMLFSLSACSGGSGGPPREDRGVYEGPDFLLSPFTLERADADDPVRADLSHTSEGYFAVSAFSEKKLKLQVFHGDETYTYNISSDGSPSVFPLQCGSGSYSFRVMENTTDNKYIEIYRDDMKVQLKDEFQPFLRPSDYVPVDGDSACVKKAEELAQTAGDAMGLIGAVYDYITDTVRYDTKKAKAVTSGYMPDPDETMKTGKGICFDYASLAAAMLRSQGIPTKVVFGYVSPDDLYHAWNMFYTDETGWVTVSFEAVDGWNRMDLTFSAGGVDDSFVGDGNNYADLYYY